MPEGFRVRYENTGIHQDVTDRCCSGGRIINYRVPDTGDRTVDVRPWMLSLLIGLLGTAWMRIAANAPETADAGGTGRHIQSDRFRR